MSAFSTVGGVFAVPEFSSPSNSFQWGLGALANANRECAGFLIMVQMSGVWMHTAATNKTTLHLALDSVTIPLTFLCFSISRPPTSLAPTESCAANMNKERLQTQHERMRRPRA